MESTTFGQWLDAQMQQRELNQSELSRAININQAAVSRLLSGKSSPSPDTLKSIARVFHLPVEEVFRAAGLLPPVPEERAKAEELAHLASELPESALDDVLEFARHRLQLAEKRGEYATHKEKSP